MVVWYAILHPTAFAAGATPMQKWVDIGIWGCFLILTAAALGYLYDYRQNAHAELTQAYNGVLQILSKFIDTADRYTEAHSVRVSQGATAIAREMRLSHSEVEDVRVAALLHDVGKVDVSLDVLRKAGDLTAEEWDEIQKHPEDGARMVQQVGGIMRNAVPLILYHHEKYEGTGYYRLRGEDIPLGSRIIAVADAFDAMTIHRSYSAAKSSDEAMGILRKDSGSHFDPKVVEAFASVRHEVGIDPEAARERLRLVG